MTDDRYNDAFEFSKLRAGCGRNGANCRALNTLISGTHDWVGQCSSTICALNKHWFDLFQKRAQEDFALPQYIMLGVPHAR